MPKIGSQKHIIDSHTPNEDSQSARLDSQRPKIRLPDPKFTFHEQKFDFYYPEMDSREPKIDSQGYKKSAPSTFCDKNHRGKKLTPIVLDSTARGLELNYQCQSLPSTRQKSTSIARKLTLRGPKSTTRGPKVDFIDLLGQLFS